jgi:glutathione S-transferase
VIFHGGGATVATEGNMLKIWGRANSSNVQKVLWCCDELGIGYERIDAGGAFGRTRDPDYLALNPMGLVPTIEDGDAIVWESNTILRYLATTRGGGRLYPTNPVARTQVERWMDWQIAHLVTPMTTLLFHLVRLPEKERDAGAADAARRRGQEMWAIVDRQLADKDYIAGPSFTLADICLGIFAYRWLHFPLERETLPRLEAWHGRLAQRQAFATHVMQPIT